MLTSNEKILDAIIERQIDYIAYSQGVVKRTSPLLLETEDKLRDIIYSYYGRISKNAIYTLPARKLLAEMEVKIRALRGEAWNQTYKTVRDELKQVAVLEVAGLATVIEGAVPVTLGLAVPTSSTLASIVISQPFEGKILRDWINDGGRADVGLITNHIKEGLVQGRTVEETVSLILGKGRGKHPRNALVRKAQRDMLAIVLTGVSSVSNEARNELYHANSDIIEQVLFVATLDSRTTLECAGNDGKIFPLGESPKPPLHFRCRSAIVSYINPENLYLRPFNPTTKKQLLREYTKKNGLSKVSNRSDLPYGHKTKFDMYGRERVRELVGQVPAKTSFDDFLRRRNKEFQDNYLGPARAELYRANPKMKVDKFTNNYGDTLTLKQLESKTQ